MNYLLCVPLVPLCLCGSINLLSFALVATTLVVGVFVLLLVFLATTGKLLPGLCTGVFTVAALATLAPFG